MLFNMLLNIFMDSGTLLSIISILVSIYYAKKIDHKKIRFVVATNGEKYIIAFWNACNQVIYKEDLYEFFFLGNVNCKIETLFSSDKDIPLEIVKGQDEIYNTRHQRKCSISFDFLNRRNGYIFKIINLQPKNYYLGKFTIKGRIRGENKSSIKYYKKLQKLSIRTMKDQYVSIFLTSMSFFIVLAILVSQIYIILINGISAIRIINIFISFLGLYGLIYYSFSKAMPFHLRKEYKSFVKKNHCKEITTSNDILM